MTLLAPYEAPDIVLPGVTGGIAKGASVLAGRYGYRASKWVGRYFLKPKRPTLTKAVRRGTGLGILLSPGTDELDEVGTTPTSPPNKTRKVKQGSYRRSNSNRSWRSNNRRCGCNPCQ